MTWAVSSPIHSEITNLARDRGARAVKARLQRQAHKRLTAHLHLHELCSCLTLSGISRSHETGNSAGHAAVLGTQGSGRQTLDTGLARRAKGPDTFRILLRKERIKFTLLQIHINLNFSEISVLLRSTDGERTVSSEMGFGASGVREGLSTLEPRGKQ